MISGAEPAPLLSCNAGNQSIACIIHHITSHRNKLRGRRRSDVMTRAGQ